MHPNVLEQIVAQHHSALASDAAETRLIRQARAAPPAAPAASCPVARRERPQPTGSRWRAAALVVAMARPRLARLAAATAAPWARTPHR
jgi:hypothetical protein